MNDDSIFGCFIRSDFMNFESKNYYCPKNPNKDPRKKFIIGTDIKNGVMLLEASYNALGRLKCKVKRKKYVKGKKDEFFDLREGNSYHIMIAFSEYSVNWPRFDGLYYHYFRKAITREAVQMDSKHDLRLNFLIRK